MNDINASICRFLPYFYQRILTNYTSVQVLVSSRMLYKNPKIKVHSTILCRLLLLLLLLQLLLQLRETVSCCTKTVFDNRVLRKIFVSKRRSRRRGEKIVQ